MARDPDIPPSGLAGHDDDAAHAPGAHPPGAAAGPDLHPVYLPSAAMGGLGELDHIRGALMASPDQLPVLNAFREFLEEERKKTKRRMQRQMTLLALLVIALAGAGASAAFLRMDRLRERMDRSQRLASADARKAADSAEEKARQRNREVERLKLTVASLEAENKMMADQFDARWTFLTNHVASALLARRTTAAPARIEPPAPPDRRAGVPAADAPADANVVSLEIVPPDRRNAMTWRFPLPGRSISPR
jgi:hypothetical protein